MSEQTIEQPKDERLAPVHIMEPHFHAFVHDDVVTLVLSSPQRVREFEKLLQRSLNTWSDAPKWMFEMIDAIQKMPEIPEKLKGKET